jgi:hypothetical protein
MRRSIQTTAWSRWRASLGVLALLLLGATTDTRGSAISRRTARAAELRALDGAHERLEALMRATASARAPDAVDAQPIRSGLLGIRTALAPALDELRDDVREPSIELRRSIASALSQLDDDGAELAADRSEFVLSALVPIASALDEMRGEIAEGAP